MASFRELWREVGWGGSGKAHSKCSISVPVSVAHKDFGVRKRWEYSLLHDGPKMSMLLETGNALGNISSENEGSDGPVLLTS